MGGDVAVCVLVPLEEPLLDHFVEGGEQLRLLGPVDEHFFEMAGFERPPAVEWYWFASRNTDG